MVTSGQRAMASWVGALARGAVVRPPVADGRLDTKEAAAYDRLARRLGVSPARELRESVSQQVL